MSIEFEDVTDLQAMVDAARSRLKLPADSTTDQVYVAGFEIVLSQISSSYGKEDSSKANYLRMAVLSSIDLDGDNEETYHLAHRVGAAYLMHGWVAEAEETLNLALGGFNKLHQGEEVQSADSLKVCGSLGTLYEKSGDYKKAIALASRLLKAQENRNGLQHRDTLLSVVNVAGLLQHVGDLKQSEDMYRKAMSTLEKVCSEEKIAMDDDLDYVMCMGNFAVLLEKKKEGEGEALSYYKRSLRGKKKLLGENNPDTLRSLSNLAMLLESQGGAAEEAEAMFRECLEHRIVALGKDHVETLSSKAALAGCLLKKGMSEQSLELYSAVLSGYVSGAVGGADSPMAIQAHADLAYCLMACGKIEESLEMYKRVTSLRLSKYGASHPQTLKSFFDTGILLVQTGKNEEALNMLNAARKGYIDVGMEKEAARCIGLIEHVSSSEE